MTVTPPAGQQDTPAERLRDLAHRMHYRANDGDCPSDCAAMAKFAAELNRSVDELAAASVAAWGPRHQPQQITPAAAAAAFERAARDIEADDLGEAERLRARAAEMRLEAARAAVPGPAAPTTYALPAEPEGPLWYPDGTRFVRHSPPIGHSTATWTSAANGNWHTGLSWGNLLCAASHPLSSVPPAGTEEP